MENRLLHTPEGVRDIYGDEMVEMITLETTLRKKVRSFGYQDIETPSFEYYDIYSHEIGTTPSHEIYKFFDSENNTLALRPDFTPGVVRSAVKYFMEDSLPKRLCYLGKTFSNRSDLQGKLKEITELGVEYLGDESVEADAEMISMAVELLKSVGLKDFQICIGNEEYFRGLAEAAGLSKAEEEELSEHIRNKNYFGTMDLIDGLSVNDEIKQGLASFSDFAGGPEILDSALAPVKTIDRSVNALNRLKELYDRLGVYGVQEYVSFDLGMLSKLNYYTGIVFNAYTFGTGDAVIRGGRYDHLVEKFGKNSAAIGFTVVVDQILNTLKAQHIEILTKYNRMIIVYDEASYAEAVKLSAELRSEGIDTEMLKARNYISKEQYLSHASEIHASKVIWLENGTRKEAEL
ncbi:ATP phosphoribosyltransferase regulatory subunit [Lachnospiraceae bacterium KH1T2]|nr:ATP phosphoribosyltransferase regulatory subunit [Lachnospiraceae bacterium KH1T2]